MTCIAQHALLSEPEVAWCALKQDPRFKSEEIICLGNTPGINYADKGQLSQITDMLYFDPVVSKSNFQTNGLPIGWAGLVYFANSMTLQKTVNAKCGKNAYQLSSIRCRLNLLLMYPLSIISSDRTRLLLDRPCRQHSCNANG